MTEGPVVTASGKVLTDADIEALADEAERGYDLDKITPVEPDPVPTTTTCPSCSTKKPRYFLSEDNDGHVVAWYMCKRCHSHITQCGCSTPLAPPYVKGMTPDRPEPEPQADRPFVMPDRPKKERNSRTGRVVRSDKGVPRKKKPKEPDGGV